MKQTIIIGISSGIAAYKIVDLIRILKGKNIGVKVIMTKSAVKMFGVEMFEEATGNKIYTDLIEKDFDYLQVLKNREVEHIKIADSASLFVIAPATANIISKLAYGMADDFLTTTALAATAPVLICPSMNVHMWEKPIVSENLEKLKKMGYFIMHPDRGELVCGYEGVGRLGEPQKIAKEIFKLLEQNHPTGVLHTRGVNGSLNGEKIIVTAGGTSESIDAVRTITNRASGKMGVAIAQECYLRGADVLLLKSVTAVDANTRQDTSGVAQRDSSDGGGIKTNARSLKIEIFETSADLEQLIKKHIKNYDVLFHTAAVSDFIPEEKLDTKLDSKQSIILRLKSAPKILHKIKSWNPKIKLIGFKAVYKLSEKDLIKEGVEKLKESRSDFIIVNDIGKDGVGFAVDTNEVYIISPKGLLAKIPKASKKEVARKLIEYIFD